MKNNYLVQAWLVLTLAVGFAAGLSGVQLGLSERIESNKRNETYDQIPKLVPGADETKTVEMVAAADKVAYKAIDAEGEHVGWVIKAAGSGFADKIELLVGLDAAAERILGIYVLDQKETPALGDNITKPQWRKQFSGLDAARPVAVTKARASEADNSVEAVTGATVSSQSVCDIVNKAVAEFREARGRLKEPKAKD